MNFDIENIRESLFTDALPCGVVICANDDNMTILSANSYFYQATGGTANSILSMRQAVYPSDFFKIKESISKSTDDFEPIALRIFKKGYNTSWYQLCIKKFSEEVFIFAFFNIDTQKKIENTLRQEKSRYSSVIELSSNILVEYNCQLDVMTMGKNTRNFLGCDEIVENYLRQHDTVTRVHPDDREALYSIFKNPPKVGRLADLVMRIADSNNRYVWVKFTCKTIFDSEGKPWFVIGTLVNIDSEKREQMNLLEASSTDLMTGVLNRKAIEEHICKFFENGDSGKPCALFMLDIDDFKVVNDIYGHIAGDEILVTITSTLKQMCSPDHAIGRVGGDEFQIFIPDISGVDIQRFASDICQTLTKKCSDKLGSACTISLGIAVGDKSPTYEELYRYADMALYTAKESGKAHFEIYGHKPSKEGSNKTAAIPTYGKKLSIDIIDKAVPVMSDIHKAPDVLELVGKELGIDRVSVFVANSTGDACILMWDWENKKSSGAINCGDTIARNLFPVPNYKSNIFSSNDVKTDLLQDSTVAGLMDAGAYLQITISKNDILYGYITFAEYDGSRAWVQRELAMLQFLGNLFAESLFTQFSVRKNKQYSDNITKLLNTVLSFPVFVAKKSSGEVLYYNNMAKELIPSIEIGMHADDFCSNYDTETDATTKTYLQFHHRPNEKFPATAMHISWDGADDAYIISARDINSLALDETHEITDDFTEESLKNVLKLAMMKTYEQLLVVDMISGEVTTNFSRHNVSPIADKSASCEKFIEAFKGVVPSEYHNVIEQIFSPALLRKKFASGIDEFSAEFPRITESHTTSWTKAQIYIASKSTSSSIAIILLKEVSERKRLEQERLANEKKYRYVLENNYFNVVEQNLITGDYKNIFRKSNSRFVDRDNNSWGEMPAEFDYSNIVYKDDIEKVAKEFKHPYVKEMLKKHGSFSVQYRKLALDGKYYWVSATFCEGEKEDRALIMFKDISEEKAQQEALEKKQLITLQSEESSYYRRLLDHSNTIVFEWNEATEERYTSPKIKEWFVGNYDNRDLFDIFLNDRVVHDDDRQIIFNIIDDINMDVSHTECLVRLLNHFHNFEWCLIHLETITEQNGLKRVTGTIRNVDSEIGTRTGGKTSAPQEDALTGLFTADTFYDRCEALLALNPEKKYYIVVIDINRFKLINDFHGGSAGDAVLKYIADMLRRRTKHGDVYCRISGDIFGLFISLEEDSLIRFIDDMNIEMQSYPLPSKILLSYGIYEVISNDIPVSVMCDRAKMALSTIKGSYFSRHAFYDSTLREKMMNENRIENIMHEALENDEFQIFLQPKFSIKTNRLSGAEALIRWISQDDIFTPDHFIPLFERNGFIRMLDHYVWRRVCKFIREWLDKGAQLVPISVNVSRMNAFDESFSDYLIKLVKEFKIPVELLQLEITESAFMANEDNLIKHIKKLKNYGFRLAMDDFGAGYSSLNMLRTVPVDIIKLDKGFIDGFDESDKTKIILDSTIKMIKQMRLGIIAEGVETDEQAEFLLGCGCDEIQGFLFSEPVTADNFYTDYLSKQ